MARRILNYSISLALCLLTALPLYAQNGTAPASSNNSKSKKEQKKKPEIEYPLYNGVSVGLDLFGPIASGFGSDFFSTEVSVDVDLKHRYFPIVEIGYGTTDTWSDEGIHYKSSAPYFRIGIDYNALYKKKHGQMLLVGFRYGYSSFKYDINDLSINDDIYGGTIYKSNLEDDVWGDSLPYHYNGMKGSMHWVEFCVGIRANIWKRLYMGWSLRFKYELSTSGDVYGDPWYIPGYGKYDSSRVGVTYTITYKLPY